MMLPSIWLILQKQARTTPRILAAKVGPPCPVDATAETISGIYKTPAYLGNLQGQAR